MFQRKKFYIQYSKSATSESKEMDDKLPTETKNLVKRAECKRSKDPEKWKQNVRKRLRQSGQEYLSVAGKVVNKKKVHPGCADTCHLSCKSKISPELRQTIHNMFWKLTDDQKNYFYWKYTSRIIPKRRRATTTEETRRGYTFKYKFEFNGELQYVCSKFFFSTLDISPRRIYYFYDNCYDEEICMPRTDTMHGKGRNRMPQLAQRLDEIREHIKALPTEYKNGIGNKIYLRRGMSLTKMYNMYVETTPEPLKQHWYNKVFHKEFNLEFQMSTSTLNQDNASIAIVIEDESNESDVQLLVHDLQPATEALQEWDNRNNIQTLHEI